MQSPRLVPVLGALGLFVASAGMADAKTYRPIYQPMGRAFALPRGRAIDLSAALRPMGSPPPAARPPVHMRLKQTYVNPIPNSSYFGTNRVHISRSR